MGLLHKTSIIELYQGVSRQPDELRRKGQVKDAKNMWLGIEDAVKRRPASRTVVNEGSPLSVPVTISGDHTNITGSGFAFSYSSTRYTRQSSSISGTLFRSTSLGTFPFRGEVVPLSLSYSLNLSSGDSSIHALLQPPSYEGQPLSPQFHELFNYNILTGYPFQLNSFSDSGRYGLIASDNSWNPSQYLIRCRSTNIEQGQQILIKNADGTTVQTISVPDNSTASSVFKAIDSLLPTHFTVQEIRGDGANVFYLTPNEGKDGYTIEETGGDDQYGIQVIRDNVRSPNELSESAPDGYKLFVGSSATSSYGYWVSYNERTRLWEESTNPDIDTNIINNARIVPTTDRFIPTSFQPKLTGLSFTGDDNTGRPFDLPTFIGFNEEGRSIYSAEAYRNRLAILYAGGIHFSKTDDPLYLFEDFTTQSLDTDGFGLTYPLDDRTVRWALPFRNSLFLLGENHQYELRSGDGANFSKNTVQLELSTSYQANTQARPISVGDKIFFASDVVDSSRIYEYFFDESSVSNTADDITIHTAGYIPQNITHLSGHTTTRTVFALSDEEPSKIFVYKYYQNGRTKVQSSWSEWDMGNVDIIAIGVEKDELLIALRYLNDDGSNAENNIYFEAIPLYPDYADRNDIPDVFLDGLRLLGESEEPNEDFNEILYTHTDGKRYAGRPFESSMTFSKFYPFFRGSDVPHTTGKGQVRRFSLQFRGGGEDVKIRATTSPNAVDRVWNITRTDPSKPVEGGLNGDLQDVELSVSTSSNKQMSIVKLDYSLFYNDDVIQANQLDGSSIRQP